MASHWKSTPSYWCKFCSIYVRDTSLERKNHEASAKHQNKIQRSLRELHKGKEREDRDKQRAKDEVARLNNLVGGKKASVTPATSTGPKVTGLKDVTPATKTQHAIPTYAQRKAQAEQLVALGVKLPPELEREFYGAGGWETISETVVQNNVKGEHSLADIIKGEEDSKDAAQDEINRGIHKRKADDDEDEDTQPKQRRVWGSTKRTYPGSTGDDEDEEDLDALLSGVGVKKEVKSEEVKNEDVKEEEDETEEKPLDAIPDADAPPTVVFKKRKGKK
jgi:hypothetical protein